MFHIFSVFKSLHDQHIMINLFKTLHYKRNFLTIIVHINSQWGNFILYQVKQAFMWLLRVPTNTSCEALKIHCVCCTHFLSIKLKAYIVCFFGIISVMILNYKSHFLNLVFSMELSFYLDKNDHLSLSLSLLIS